MPEQNKLIRQSEINAETNAANITANATAPVDLSFDRIRVYIQNTELPLLDKRRLIRQEIRAIAQQRKAQIEGALIVENDKIRANVNAAQKAIRVYESELIFRIRERFIDIASKVGQRVELKQLGFLEDFGEQLTKFDRELKKKDIAPRFKVQIHKSIDKAWNRMAEKLGDLTDDIIQKAHTQTKEG